MGSSSSLSTKNKVNSKKRNKTIGIRIMKLSGITCLIACFIIAISMVVVSGSSLQIILHSQMLSSAKIAKSQIEASLDSQFSYLEGLSKNPILFDSEITEQEQKSAFLKYASDFGCQDVGFAGKDGKTLTADMVTFADVSQREYYTSAMSGKRFASNPFEDSTRPGEVIMMFSVPVYENGDPSTGKIVGVLYMKQDGNFLSNITNEISIGDTGYAYMTDKTGTNIANADSSKVLNQENAINMFSDDPDFADLIKALKYIIDNEEGTETYSYNGSSKYMSFATIPEFGWKIVLSVDQHEIIIGELRAINAAVIVTILVQIVAIISILLFTKRMVGPIKRLNTVNTSLSEGDLSAKIDVDHDGKNTDEIGQMVNSMDHFVGKLKEVISSTKESSTILDDIAGKLKDMSSQSENAADSVCKAVEDVTQATIAQATEVESASNQVSILEEAINNIEEDLRNLLNMTDAAMAAEETSTAALEELIDSNSKTTAAFHEISEQINATGAATNKISEAANLITQIASQTNLLSLNASIEAARAGDAGKGFAVVATEIQQLSIQSDEAAKTIQEIVNELMAGSSMSIKKMEETLVLISDQSDRLKKTEDESSLVGTNVSQMRDSAYLIKDNLKDCDEVKKNVSNIITNLSAISEENAASSEETNASMEELNANIGIISDSAKNIARIANELNNYMEFWTLESK